MNETPLPPKPASVATRLPLRLLGVCASWQLTGALVLLWCAALAYGARLEAKQGYAYAAWFVYEAGWFYGVLALVGFSVICLVVTRLFGARRNVGLVVAGCGVLIVLAGSVQSRIGGVHGVLKLTKGEKATQVRLDDTAMISVNWTDRAQASGYNFTFKPGPVDWPAGQSLRLGEIDGVEIRVLQYIALARAAVDWSRDPTNRGGPFVRFRVTGPDGATVAEHWLADEQYGDALLVGPMRLQLEHARSAQMVADFRQPESAALGERGLLTMYSPTAARQVLIDEALGQTIALDSNTRVEIAAYLPHAAPDRRGGFISKSQEPKNPLVELRVYVAGEPKPFRQIAFAKDPLLNLDGVYGHDCPVKFRYRHPAVKTPPGVELLQAADGKLYGRICTGGHYAAAQEVVAPAAFDLPGPFHVSILEHLAHAQQNVRFEPVARVAERAAPSGSPAALVEVVVAGKSQTVWLPLGDTLPAPQFVSTPTGPLSLSLSHGQFPLPFSVELPEIKHRPADARVNAPPFTGTVRLEAPADSASFQEVPFASAFSHAGYTFRPARLTDAGHGRERAAFTVHNDPGVFARYTGGLLACLGLCAMPFLRAGRTLAFRQTAESHVVGSASPAAARDAFVPAPHHATTSRSPTPRT